MVEPKIKRYGSRAEVFHGKAKMTTGRLKKADFVKNKIGRIVSKKKLTQSKNPIAIEQIVENSKYRTADKLVKQSY